MKCENCKGTGRTESPYYPGYFECTYCDGSGVEEPLTNEEFIRNCSTEELAEFLQKTTMACFVCGMDGLDEKRCPFGLECAGPKEIMQWLKQKHNE